MSRRSKGGRRRPGFTLGDHIRQGQFVLNQPVLPARYLGDFNIDVHDPDTRAVADRVGVDSDSGTFSPVEIIKLVVALGHNGPGRPPKLTIEAAALAWWLCGARFGGCFDAVAEGIRGYDPDVLIPAGLAWRLPDGTVEHASAQQIGNTFRRFAAAVDSTPVPSRHGCPTPQDWKAKYDAVQVHDPVERARLDRALDLFCGAVLNACMTDDVRIMVKPGGSKTLGYSHDWTPVDAWATPTTRDTATGKPVDHHRPLPDPEQPDKVRNKDPRETRSPGEIVPVSLHKLPDAKVDEILDIVDSRADQPARRRRGQPYDPGTAGRPDAPDHGPVLTSDPNAKWGRQSSNQPGKASELHYGYDEATIALSGPEDLDTDEAGNIGPPNDPPDPGNPNTALAAMQGTVTVTPQRSTKRTARQYNQARTRRAKAAKKELAAKALTHLVIAADLTPASNATTQAAAVRLRHITLEAFGWMPGHCLADAGYANINGWTDAMRATGDHLIADLPAPIRGRKAPSNGALPADGAILCPYTPDVLVELKPPPRGASTAARGRRRQHDADHDERSHYEATITDPGGDSQPLCQCPARRGTAGVACPRYQPSMRTKGDIPLVNPADEPPEHWDACCTQDTFTVDRNLITKTRQLHTWGNRQWRRSYRRRTVVERTYASVNDRARGNIGFGSIRCVGRTKTRLIRTMSWAAHNMSVIATFYDTILDLITEMEANDGDAIDTPDTPNLPDWYQPHRPRSGAPPPALPAA